MWGGGGQKYFNTHLYPKITAEAQGRKEKSATWSATSVDVLDSKNMAKRWQKTTKKCYLQVPEGGMVTMLPAPQGRGCSCPLLSQMFAVCGVVYMGVRPMGISCWASARGLLKGSVRGAVTRRVGVCKMGTASLLSKSRPLGLLCPLMPCFLPELRMAGPTSESMSDQTPILESTKQAQAPEGFEYATNAHYLCGCECYDGTLKETTSLYGLFSTHDRVTGFSCCFCVDGCSRPLCFYQSPALTQFLLLVNSLVCCPVLATMAVPISQCDRGYQNDDCKFRGCCYHLNYD